MNRIQIGKLEVTLDGAVEHTVNVFRNGKGLQVEGDGFLQTGDYLGGQKGIMSMALRKAQRQYGEEAEVRYHPQ